MAVKSILCLAFVFFSVALHSQPRDNSNVAVDALCVRAEKKLFTQPDSAFILARQALALAKDLQYHEGIANSLFLTGSVFFHQGFYQEALKNLLDAQLLFEQAGDNDKTAANLNQLGLIYYNLRQPDVAFQRHQQALALYEKSGSTTGLAYTYGCLGRLFEKKQDYTRALEDQQKALEYYERVHDLRGMATILENIGSIHEDLEAYDTAKDFLHARSPLTNRPTTAFP
jgi:tetratricopeptide (TPR) repeat protein